MRSQTRDSDSGIFGKRYPFTDGQISTAREASEYCGMIRIPLLVLALKYQPSWSRPVFTPPRYVGSLAASIIGHAQCYDQPKHNKTLTKIFPYTAINTAIAVLGNKFCCSCTEPASLY